MNITKEQVDALNAVVTLEVAKEDFMPQVEEGIREFRKNFQMKGFRKGMVPKGLVKKMYGNSILAEKVNQILNEKIHTYVQENELQILGNPIPADDQELNLDINTIDNFNFKYDLGMSPEFELTYLEKKPKFTLSKIKVEDEQIDEQVDRMRKQYGSMSEPEEIKDNDVLTVTFTELDAEGAVKEGGIQQETSLMVDMVKDKKAQKQILAAGKGVTLEVNLFDLYDRTKEDTVKHALGMEPANVDFEALSDKFSMSIDRISRIEPAELNEEFFNKVYGEGTVTDEAGMRAKISEEIGGYYSQFSDNKLGREIVENVIDNVNIDLPEAFLKRWIQMTNEQPITAEQIENDFEQFAKGLKWSLITNKISKEQNLVVEDSEVLESVKAQARQQFMQYGLSHIGDEELTGFAQKQMADHNYSQKMRTQLLEQKVVEYMRSVSKITESETTLEEFNKENA